eukprot:scaffold10186_cov33-Attheya_sp.AAC.1
MRAFEKVFVALAVFARIGEVYVVTAAELSRFKPVEQEAKTATLSGQDPGFGKDRKEGLSLKDAANSFQDDGVYTNYDPRMQQEREEEEGISISGVVDSQQEKEEAWLLAKGGNLFFNEYKNEPARHALLKKGQLRGAVDGAVDSERKRSFCNKPSNIFDNSATTCTGGSEFGRSCKSDGACYSGSCGADNKCECPEESNCWGCASNTAACVRLEQTHPSKKLEVCKFQAYYLYTNHRHRHRPYEMFSAGAAHTNHYENLPYLTGSHSKSSKSSKCVVANPTGEEGNLLLPAFVQSNVATANMDEISRIRLIGPDDSVLDSILFANGNWVKTIDLSDKSKKSKTGKAGVYVDYWPREM